MITISKIMYNQVFVTIRDINTVTQINKRRGNNKMNKVNYFVGCILSKSYCCFSYVYEVN